MVMEVIKYNIGVCFQLVIKELKNSFKKPIYHWLCWIFPLLLFALLNASFSKGTLLDIPVAAVDNDHSHLSKKIMRQLNAASHAQIISYGDDLGNAKRALEHGDVYAVLYIPLKFEKNVLSGNSPNVVFLYNALFYASGSYSSQDFSGLVAEINNTYRPILNAHNEQPAIKLSKFHLVYSSLFNPSGSFVYYQQFAATIHLIQLFVVTTTIYILGHTRKTNSLVGFNTMILCKIIPYTVIFTLLLVLELAILITLSDAKINGNPLYILCVGFCYILAAQSLGLILYTFTPSTNMAFTLIGLLVSIALSFSGLAMPEFSLSSPGKLVSELEPLTHALKTMFDIFLRHVSATAIMKSCGILLIYPIVTFILIRRRLYFRIKLNLVGA
ncbi:ABC transporter permease [Yersinia enterocolitica]|uniref:ABC transporter permease n=1 Tax=Yersinia enterocolitica TaxID=630 RepID=UPI0021E8FC4B|nr:ABC transporter permease [Yersinia enterocolitica]UYK00562.1 ABC transporter permease [Yersinia enterocolitica]